MAITRVITGRFSALRALAFVLAVLALPSIGPAPAAAAEERESPRVAATIGPVGVVLIAANAQLYAFVDRLSDNAPVPGLRVRVTGGKTDLTLAETAPGIYRAGPFTPPAGRVALTVSVAGAAVNGQAAVELVTAAPAPASATEGRSRSLWYAIGVAALGGLGWLAWRGRRRVPPLAGAGTV